MGNWDVRAYVSMETTYALEDEHDRVRAGRLAGRERVRGFVGRKVAGLGKKL